MEKVEYIVCCILTMIVLFSISSETVAFTVTLFAIDVAMLSHVAAKIFIRT